mmetsp:Transcript_11071/g.24390  ORF Transcript_11071/g.24390 Transcript_11071/m.24390 type:complete len:552 (-) Transcript_11071:88-1743(-)|eukprot:CAMPEP_0206488852 /NCGR_PEP_ID=MMETSP0324_2-20121206/42717_1 /ASSEMBLY_ACC=CAM_ASM_000836 /TAXON_ID=2866 /ORGANISM="Crypthecodinium cohnii, Strain Seligo" /LENGTH=551 /DNA_ID=CAMNT_0053968071 /DNA_START=107 /DNA_END=1762 /DNA_ORIENTATION=-
MADEMEQAAEELLSEEMAAEEIQAIEQKLAEAAPEVDDGGEDDEAAEEEMQDLLAKAAQNSGVEVQTAALDGEESDSQDSEDEEHKNLDEHLKDSLEGSLRLKRLLSRDDDMPAQKKRKHKLHIDTDKEKKAKALMTKWNLLHDKVVKHVLDGSTVEDLDDLEKTGYVPQVWEGKSISEAVAKFINELRERKMSRGTACDPIAAFSHRWKLDLVAQQALRMLSHKDLRYVMDHFDGKKELKEVIQAASEAEVKDDFTASTSVLQAPGLAVLTRFSRLELIDPTADAAVFGDANLTFGIKLAKHRKALGHVGRVIATTFEELETLRERYKEIDDSIALLEDHFAEVHHGVDCTKIALNPNFKGLEGKLGAVYYNFPHSGAIGGFYDGHPVVNWRHENLMRLFFRALRTFVKPGGLVKVASNCGAVGVRYSYIVGSAIENEFLHIETMPFLEWHLHRYGRSYGDKRDVYKRPDAVNNQSYNAQAADRDMVYCFAYQPSGNAIPPQTIRLPPNLKTLLGCVDGPFKSAAGPAKQQIAEQLHNRFITEISGTHVG